MSTPLGPSHAAHPDRFRALEPPARDRREDPNVDERNTGRRRDALPGIVKAGADVVVGGHPHITQGVDSYKGKPIVYSLGNFVFDGFDAVEQRRGWLLRLTLGKDTLLAWDTLLADVLPPSKGAA